MVTRLTTVAFL